MEQGNYPEQKTNREKTGKMPDLFFEGKKSLFEKKGRV
jgi:hypothetical protein